MEEIESQLKSQVKLALDTMTLSEEKYRSETEANRLMDTHINNIIEDAKNKLARKCHELNRAYCKALGDSSQLPWESAPEWVRQSAIAGVNFHIDHPEARADSSHESWMKMKVAVTNGAKVIHIRRLKLDPGVNLLS
ncbi:hypothetical protein ACT9N5_16845 [Edwardsiella piscicida]|uniref:Uncharacterized protein n=5 Tax=Edwardsiella piscicida TaxID=1263550 RepID=A0AAQ3H4B6_EDWPI|nr:hypothetical protein [Edwardsiella piscicida]QHR95284.1 hypothetical protein GT752_08405 [Edwardsiella piscicida]UJT82106.1 hypothetical protein L1P07_14690 [Edwardsiella piscicida]UJT85366.1 hypothetical protein L1P05_14630 [Edwardsiella piscicida]WCF11944.1 hypothetical protein N4G58_11320 [Edwardsiella piscicida]WDU90635.1 hypothetical protein PWJ79_14635 [Edwardsiella piscicida]